ncbi:MAG: phage holin family protein [Acidobacteriota bacterium]
MAWERGAAHQEKSAPLARWPQNMEERESLGELLGELASQSASLVRDEVALARQEIQEKLKIVQTSLTVIAIGGVLALASLLTLSAAAVLMLAEYLKPWQSALVVGLVIAIIASVIILAGISQLKNTTLKPEQTLETIEENKEWLKEIS